jgi:hypothetical protein
MDWGFPVGVRSRSNPGPFAFMDIAALLDSSFAAPRYQFPFNYFECSILLFGSQYAQSNRACRQVSKLHSNGVSFLIDETYFEA